MKRIKDLDIFQQGLLAAMAVMVLVFSVLYPIALCRKGIEFRNALLVRHAKIRDHCLLRPGERP